MNQIHSAFCDDDAPDTVDATLNDLTAPDLLGVSILSVITGTARRPDTGVRITVQRHAGPVVHDLTVLDAGVLSLAIQRTEIRTGTLILIALRNAMAEAERRLEDIHTATRAALKMAAAA